MKTILLALVLLLSLCLSAQVDTSKVYTVVQRMPEFPGGEDSMVYYLARHVHYPEAAIDSSVQGKVWVGLTVNADGHVSDVAIKKSVHPLLDAEAVKVVKAFPLYRPGQQNGTPVKVALLVPVTFRIQIVDTSEPDFVLPGYPGGLPAMNAYVKANIRRPTDQHCYLGLMPVAFDVDSAGGVSNASCLMHVSDAVDSEAARVVNTFPRFTPGMEKGKKVSCRIKLNISFFDDRYVVDADGFYNGVALEHEPSFVGGKAAEKDLFEKYLYKFYVERDKTTGLAVEFAIHPDSTISNIKVVKGTSAINDNALVAAIRNIKFIPASYNHKPVKTRVSYMLDSATATNMRDSSAYLSAEPVFLGMPKFPGGEAMMMKIIQMHIRYPDLERENDIQGRVVISFVVGKEGHLEDIRIKNGVSKNIDEEALRVIRLLPDFIPGSKQGKTVKVAYLLPITFKLADKP